MDVPTLGAVSSPYDYRDTIAASAVPSALAGITIPESYDTDLGPDYNQRLEPACVAHSAAEVLRLYWFRKTGQSVNFSPRFLDIMAKRFDGQDRATGGTYPRLVFKLMTEYGCATEDVLPNNTMLPILEYRDDSLITQAILDNAAQYKIPGYVAIPKELTRQAIFLYGAVSALFRIGNEWWTPSWADSAIDPLRPPQAAVGGHQVTPKGFSGLLNRLRNHWSTVWANNDEANYDPAAWAPFILEQWAIAEIPPDTADFLKALPSPSDFHYSWQTNLTYGDFNDDVKFAQIALMILGFVGPITPDQLGHYGPLTATAVAKYQQAHQIPAASHNIGPLTRAALNSQFSI